MVVCVQNVDTHFHSTCVCAFLRVLWLIELVTCLTASDVLLFFFHLLSSIVMDERTHSHLVSLNNNRFLPVDVCLCVHTECNIFYLLFSGCMQLVVEMVHHACVQWSVSTPTLTGQRPGVCFIYLQISIIMLWQKNICETFLIVTTSIYRWTGCAPMAKRRGGVGVATWHGFLYAIGGHDAPASSLSSRLSDCVERWVWFY